SARPPRREFSERQERPIVERAPTAAEQDSQWRSPAALPRFSLVGRLEDLKPEDVTNNLVPACYIGYHKDAAWWLPGNRIHESKWVRLVVEEVYWIGGFGDRAYIGWIPLEEWQSVTPEEIESIICSQFNIALAVKPEMKFLCDHMVP
ncbi:MAG: hypothetical protein EOP49_36315, partial [Sphingobacteriales bacterium]